jgi:hypothetical protein
MRIKVVIADAASIGPRPAVSKKQEDDVATRALANPEVQRFRELFGGEVRAVRNLKE